MPKKKGGKKGAKVIDGLATNEMTREQLMGHVKRIQMELDREREERNFFMLEREKLYALWNLTLEQLSLAKTDARLATVKMDENENAREVEMHVYKQKLRYLMTEQSHKVSQVRLHNLEKMKHVQEDTWSIQNSMRDQIDQKNNQISKIQLSLHQMVQTMKLENAENASKLHTNLCAEIRRMESTYERLMFQREKTQALLEAEEIIRTNVEKSEHIQKLIDLHDNQLAQMKEFFNEITVNNFAVISALQIEISEMRKREMGLQSEISKGRRDFRILEETILEGKKEFDKKLKEDRKSAEMVKKELQKYGKRLKEQDKYTRVLEVRNETLLQKLEMAEKERDLLKGTFTTAILDMQKKSNMKRLILEMKLNAMANTERSSGPDLGGASGDNEGLDFDVKDIDPAVSRSVSSVSEV